MMDLIEINLLPIEERKIRKDYSHLLDTKVVLPTLILIGVFLFCFFKGKYDANKIEEQHKIVAQLNTDIQNRMEIRNSIKQLDKILQEKKAKNNSLQSIRFNKQLWVRMLEGLNKALPVNTWIYKINQDSNSEQEMKLEGATYLFSEVASYMIELEKNNFFQSVNLETIRLNNSQAGRNAFEFTLVIKLNLGLGATHPVAVSPKFDPKS